MASWVKVILAIILAIIAGVYFIATIQSDVRANAQVVEFNQKSISEHDADLKVLKEGFMDMKSDVKVGVQSVQGMEKLLKMHVEDHK